MPRSTRARGLAFADVRVEAAASSSTGWASNAQPLPSAFTPARLRRRERARVHQQLRRATGVVPEHLPHAHEHRGRQTHARDHDRPGRRLRQQLFREPLAVGQLTAPRVPGPDALEGGARHLTGEHEQAERRALDVAQLIVALRTIPPGGECQQLRDPLGPQLRPLVQDVTKALSRRDARPRREAAPDFAGHADAGRTRHGASAPQGCRFGAEHGRSA